eukprot:scaffold273526_cov40-Attheya_sp.AAC.1
MAPALLTAPAGLPNSTPKLHPLISSPKTLMPHTLHYPAKLAHVPVGAAFRITSGAYTDHV